jgi:hypothetical protein
MPSHLRPRVRLGLRAAPDVCFQHVGSMTMVGNFWAAGAALAAHTPGARRYFGAVARCSDPRSFAPRPPHPPSRAPPSPPPSLACFGRRRERWRAFDSISLRSQPARAARLSRGRSSCCCFPPPYRPLRRCRTRAFDRLWGTRPSGTLWPLGAPSPLSRHSAFGHSVASGALGLRAFYGLSGHPLPSRGTRPLGIRSPLGHSAFGHSAASRGILSPLAALGLRAFGRLWGTRPSGTLRPLGALSPPLLASAIPPFATSPPTTGTGPRPRQTDDILPGDDNLCSATPRRPTKHLQDPQLSPSPLARSLARTGFRSDSSHSFTSRLSPAAHTALDSRLPQQLPPRMPSRASQSSPPPLLRSLYRASLRSSCADSRLASVAAGVHCFGLRLPQQQPPRVPSRASRSSPPPLVCSLS